MDKRIYRHLKPINDSWPANEMYVKVKGQWMYLYRAVDSEGSTVDFYLSESRDKQAASRKPWLLLIFVNPRVITIDKNPAYPVAIQELKERN